STPSKGIRTRRNPPNVRQARHELASFEKVLINLDDFVGLSHIYPYPKSNHQVSKAFAIEENDTSYHIDGIVDRMAGNTTNININPTVSIATKRANESLQIRTSNGIAICVPLCLNIDTI